MTPRIIGSVVADEETGFSHAAELSLEEHEVADADAEDVAVESLRNMTRLGTGTGKPVICSNTPMAGGLLIFTARVSTFSIWRSCRIC